MKKLCLNLFVLLALVLTSCSSSDDDNGAVDENKLTVTIDGQSYVFNSIIVNEDVDNPDYLNVTATIDNLSDRVIAFYMLSGNVGSSVIQSTNYYNNGDSYDSWDFSTVVSVNNGSRIEATFSGVMYGWNEDTQEYDEIIFTNGSFKVSY